MMDFQIKNAVTAILVGFGLAACAVSPKISDRTHDEPRASVPPSNEVSAVEALETKLQHAIDLLRANDASAGAIELHGVIDSNLFPLLSSSQQHASFYLAGLLAYEDKDHKEAHRYFVLSTSFSEADGDDWWYRLMAADDGTTREYSLSLIALAQNWPDKLADVNDRFVVNVLRRMKEDKELIADRWQLLDALSKSNWKLEFYEPSYLWQELTLHLLEIGETARASEVSHRVLAPSYLIGMRADRRFKDVVVADPGYFSINEATERNIEMLRTVAAENPQSLDALVELTYGLLTALRYDEVLQLTTAALEKIRLAGPNESAPYTDVDSKQIWIIDNRVRALEGLGRWNEAATQLAIAASMSENGHTNVSQAINLAMLYADMGRVEDARQTIAKVGDDLSGYGKMQVELARLFVAVQEVSEDVNPAFKYLAEHRHDSEEAYQTALIAMNRLDDAARLLISRLDDPETRIEALLEVQEYRRTPAAPFAERIRQRKRSVIRRPEVQAAIAKVGSIEKYDIDSTPN